MSVLDLVREDLREFAGYASARRANVTGNIWLNANESPWTNDADKGLNLNRYPEPQPQQLVKRLASLYGVDSASLMITRGSDEGIDLLYTAFCNPGVDNVILCPPTYGMYKVSADTNDILCKEVALTEDFQLQVSKILDSIDEYTKIIWLCSPNNPTANLLRKSDIQYIVEKELMDVCEQFHATAAWAIVQRVKTGAILALACLPDFDPNQYGRESSDVWRNAAIGEVYEPGSTMKAMVVAAALNEKIITPESTIDVGAGTMFYGGRILRDHVQGVIDISTLIQKSSNIGAAKLGLMLNNRRLEAYFRGFGFGSKSGIDLPGEEQGIFMPHRQWSKLTPTRIPIGQGISVTALQMLGAYCAIANNGQLMWPHVVEKIESQDGEILYQAEPKVIARPIRPEVAETVRKMLVRVTETGGTAKGAAVAHYTVAGKTGTAQIPIRGGYSNTDYWASFVGFCPAESSEFGVIVVVERPKPKYHGGYVAAPVFAKITEAVANYLEIPSNLDRHAEDKTSIVKKSELGAPANHNAVVWSSTP